MTIKFIIAANHHLSMTKHDTLDVDDASDIEAFLIQPW